MSHNTRQIRRIAQDVKETARAWGHQAILESQLLGFAPFFGSAALTDTVIKDSLPSPVRTVIIWGAGYLAHRKAMEFFDVEMHFYDNSDGGGIVNFLPAEHIFKYKHPQENHSSSPQPDIE